MTRTLTVTLTTFDAMRDDEWFALATAVRAAVSHTLRPGVAFAGTTPSGDLIHRTVPTLTITTSADVDTAPTRTATDDAVLLLSMRVNRLSNWPSFADCVLLNAMRHINGEPVDDPALFDATCGVCGAPLPLDTWRGRDDVDYCSRPMQCAIDAERDQ